MGTQLIANRPFESARFQVSSTLKRVLADTTVKADLDLGSPSAPVAGMLPLARVIPQDVHSVLDYGNALAVGAGAFATSCPRAMTASILLAASGIGVASITDYRLSVAKIVPIETHEKIDYLWGVTAIAAPFVLGYWKTAPKVALSHVMSGIGNVFASLITDYRACRGIGTRLRALEG